MHENHPHASIYRTENGSNPLAAGDAEGAEAPFGLSFFHGVDERYADSGAAIADWVAKGDGSAVDIYLFHWQLQFS